MSANNHVTGLIKEYHNLYLIPKNRQLIMDQFDNVIALLAIFYVGKAQYLMPFFLAK